MAFTCRTEEKHDEILEKICASLGVKAKNKAVLKLIENYENLVTSRDEYFQRMNKLDRELSSLKEAVANRFQAENQLLKLIE